MLPKTVAIAGGTGFLGTALTPKLAAAGWHVRILTRHPERHRALKVVPQAELVQTRLSSDASLQSALAGCSAVINLVGILNSRTRDGAEFTTVHAELPARLAVAARATGASRFVHVSALRADAENGPSQYLRSKGAGEAALRRATSGHMGLTIFQPSTIYGTNDSFTNRFADLLRLPVPFMPLPKPNARFAPVHVDDVANAIVHAVNERETVGKTYQLCGPQVLSLREVVTMVRDALGLRRYIMGMPDPIARMQATLLEFVPGKPLSRDNLKSLEVNSICDNNGFKSLGIEPRPAAIWIPRTVRAVNGEDPLDDYRRDAGR
ncbi:MAG: complex I NDUFA9 subunit family protein [Gammaproteobacteria bacterium]